MILLTLLLLVFALCLWLLLAPVRLEIDTFRGIYRVRGWGVLTLDWRPEEGPEILDLGILFFRKRFRLGASEPERQPVNRKKKAPPKRSARQRFRPERWVGMVADLLKTFRVRDCRIWWDTDDFVRNAWLFPASLLLRPTGIRLSVNFQGRREVVVLIENRMGRLLWSFLKSTIFK